MEIPKNDAFKRHVFENSPIPIVVMDAETYEYLDCNPAAVKKYNYPSKEAVIGKKLLDFSAPIQYDDTPSAEKAVFFMEKAKREGLVVFEWKHRRPGGEMWDAEVHLLSFTIATKHLLQFSLIDITNRKQAEQEHLKYEQQLQQMQKLEALGILAGGIAHDFNNLMGGIFGYIDLASAETDKKAVSTYLAKAMTAIDRSRALTRQLLTFAKGGDPVSKTGNLFPFVEETAKFALSSGNVSCAVDAPKDLWTCSFDKNQIGQVIDNLIINAQQAMPVGGTIKLSARNITFTEKEHPLLSKGNYVGISIRDSGIGIPKEFIPKIFDPFFTTKTKGHGLGLAICYSIIKRHGGYIDVESEPGKGSVFNVYLPASTDTVADVSEKMTPLHRGSGDYRNQEIEC